MWKILYRLASPPRFYALVTRWHVYILLVSLAAFAYGLFGGLYLAPADYQQGDAFRIIYVHVPSAFCSLMVYGVMAFMALLSLVWRIKLADVVLQVSAPLGACFTALALVTGSLWGKPMWGTWWLWDARLTSELILLFIYIGIIGLSKAFSDKQARAKACAILVLLGAVDLPIIHYSVYWWQSLHQGRTLTLFGPKLIDTHMLYPLLAMLLAFVSFYVQQMLVRARSEVVQRERNSAWVKEFRDDA